MKYSTGFALLLIAMTLKGAKSVVQTCPSPPCDLKTCSQTSTQCDQVCSATPCATTCSSPAGCNATCPAGGCSKMSCDNVSPVKQKPYCYLSCESNCLDMSCKSYLCHPICLKDNCKMTCSSEHATSQCYPKCNGKNCKINCLSRNCEVTCNGGGCSVTFGPKSEGAVACPKGNCTLTCHPGKSCTFINACPNCVKKVAVLGSGTIITPAVNLVLFSLLSVWLAKTLWISETVYTCCYCIFHVYHTFSFLPTPALNFTCIIWHTIKYRFCISNIIFKRTDRLSLDKIERNGNISLHGCFSLSRIPISETIQFYFWKRMPDNIYGSSIIDLSIIIY